MFFSPLNTRPPLFSPTREQKINTSLAVGSIGSRRKLVDTLYQYCCIPVLLVIWCELVVGCCLLETATKTDVLPDQAANLNTHTHTLPHTTLVDWHKTYGNEQRCLFFGKDYNQNSKMLISPIWRQSETFDL